MEWKTHSGRLGKRFITITLLAIVVDASVSAENSISGKVLNHNGKPVPGAEVMLVVVNKSGVFPTTTSNKDGVFRFDRVRFEGAELTWRYELRAKKDADYLMSPGEFILGFPTSGYAPQFRLAKDAHVRGKIIQFGPPGGRLIIRFKGHEGEHLTAKFKIAAKGEKPRINMFNYIPLNVVMPAGEYDIQVFTMDGERVEQLSARVRPKAVAEKMLSPPDRLLPKLKQ